MGMFDTYIPCEKLKQIVIEKTNLKDFDWQTKSLDCELLDLNIDENLEVTSYNESYTFPNDSFIDSPYVNQGLLLLEFSNNKLKSILYIFNPIDMFGCSEKPDILIEFKDINSYECNYIYDFDYKCKALIKRNYLCDLYMSS